MSATTTTAPLINWALFVQVKLGHEKRGAASSFEEQLQAAVSRAVSEQCSDLRCESAGNDSLSGSGKFEVWATVTIPNVREIFDCHPHNRCEVQPHMDCLAKSVKAAVEEALGVAPHVECRITETTVIPYTGE